MNYVAAMTIGFILCAVALCVFLVLEGDDHTNNQSNAPRMVRTPGRGDLRGGAGTIPVFRRDVWRLHGEDITLRIINDAILSTVNESFTVAPVSTDAEKLSIAVKALESASISLAVSDGDYETLSLIRQALKEIQG